MDRLITTAELAQLAHTSPSTVRFWRYQGTGPKGVKIGKRVLYREADVIAWLNDRFETSAA